MCEECGHIHREDVFCHVYVEAADGDIGDIISDVAESSSESESDSDDGSLGLPKRNTAVAGTAIVGKQPKMKPLLTPKYVKRMGYIR